ncbi:MAG: succinate dehydrogenase assembly factor 2 [Alphaproteobacteria bacterium]|jgi:antitoxin CptB|nr:succinate dehydrogenase assembly factor 2 [Alphaproteobacteria bacterium]MDP6813934.1 succinate dehydrogenase assembly factor 2 [Alphaproteobacteria bacterium]
MDEDLETRRKRLRYRSWHRGTKELDLVLGQFAERHLAAMSELEMAQYEAILEEDEQDIYAWLARREPAPERHDNAVMKLILNFKMSA